MIQFCFAESAKLQQNSMELVKCSPIVIELYYFQTPLIDPAHKIRPGGIQSNKNLTQITKNAQMPSYSL